MTTIAYRDGVLAADTMICDGIHKYAQCSKIAVSKNGWAAAVAGTLNISERFRQWVDGKSVSSDIRKWPPMKEDTQEAIALMLSPEGEPYLYEGLSLIRVHANFLAEGSGKKYALGAMSWGADARAAIATAMAHDPCTGGAIEHVRHDPMSPYQLKSESRDRFFAQQAIAA